MKIEAPKRVTVKDGIVRLLVRSTYNFGKGVKGKANVVLSSLGYYGSQGTSSFQIDGKAYVDFAIGASIQNIFQNQGTDELKCTITATVSDHLTGKLIRKPQFSSLRDFISSNFIDQAKMRQPQGTYFCTKIATESRVM